MTDRRTAHWHRKADEMRSRGLVRRSLWAYREDWPRIQAFAEKLTENRDKLDEMTSKRRTDTRASA